MYSKVALLLFALNLNAQAHEMTPAYPKFNYSYIEGVYVAKMFLFNRRNDVSYYQIGVFTLDWKEIPFASTSKLIKVKHAKKYPFDVYIRNSDLDRVGYICTISKVFKGEEQKALITSRICSKIE